MAFWPSTQQIQGAAERTAQFGMIIKTKPSKIFVF
jgi:hypothetical protein